MKHEEVDVEKHQTSKFEVDQASSDEIRNLALLSNVFACSVRVKCGEFTQEALARVDGGFRASVLSLAKVRFFIQATTTAKCVTSPSLAAGGLPDTFPAARRRRPQHLLADAQRVRHACLKAIKSRLLVSPRAPA